MKERRNGNLTKQSAFTIVELLIVIVVIAILAAIALVAYGGFSDRAETAVIKSDLTQAAKELAVDKTLAGSYHDDSDNPNDFLTASDGVTYQYTSDSATFCLSATKGDKAYHVTENKSPQEGVCSGHTAPSSGGSGGAIANGSLIQDVTSANCPTDRTRVVDARDNRSYWVQELADGRCWMLTNLAYAGGGTNTYGDVKTIVNGTSDPTGTYTEPRYYISSGANPTNEPTDPSTSTAGAGQYGYHYNWCAALGNQQDTAACMDGVVAHDESISICPAGWRLPTGGYYGGELTALNTAINGGSATTDAGLRSEWLAQYSGSWVGFFTSVGSYGYYWTSTSAHATSVYGLRHRSTSVVTTGVIHDKRLGYSIRCTAI